MNVPFKPGDKVMLKLSHENTGTVHDHYFKDGILMIMVLWDDVGDDALFDYPVSMIQHAHNGVEWMVRLV